MVKKIIQLTQNAKQGKTDIKNELDNFEKLFKNIIIYSKEKNTLAVYIKDTFWIKSLKEYDIPDLENINNWFKLRKSFREYNNLINILFPEETKSLEPKKKRKYKSKYYREYK